MVIQMVPMLGHQVRGHRRITSGESVVKGFLDQPIRGEPVTRSPVQHGDLRRVGSFV